MPDVLAPELEEFIEREIASGKFRSPQEVLEEALRLLRERERKLDALRAEILLGVEELERGEGILIRNEAERKAYVEGIAKRGRERMPAETKDK